MKYLRRAVPLTLMGALSIRDRGRHCPGRCGGVAISDVPLQVREAALAAFEARRPGVEVLRLAEDTREERVDRFELRFVGRAARVVVRVTPQGAELRLDVTADPAEADLVVALEQLAPSLRVVSRMPLPASFRQVPHGFVSVTGTPGDAERPTWCTAWVRV